MKLNRRQAVIGIGATIAAPFIGLQAIAKQQPQSYPERLIDLGQHNRVFHTAQMWLRRCCKDGYNEKAVREFGHLFYPILSNEIQERTGLPLEPALPGYYIPNVERFDLGASVSWKIHNARESRWDIIGRAFQIMVDTVVNKIEQEKRPGSVIKDFQLWDDCTLYKQRRMGYYCWAELRVPKP